MQKIPDFADSVRVELVIEFDFDRVGDFPPGE
jgi:hypothetical protein